jgi:hypothetical protein
MRPYLKKKRMQNRAGGVSQVEDCLPSKHEALSSNNITAKKKKERKKERKKISPCIGVKATSPPCMTTKQWI